MNPVILVTAWFGRCSGAFLGTIALFGMQVSTVIGVTSTCVQGWLRLAGCPLKQ